MWQLATTSNNPSEEGSLLKATRNTELLPHQLVATVFWTADPPVTFFLEEYRLHFSFH